MKTLLLVFISFFITSNLLANEDRLQIGLLYEKIFSSKKEATIGTKLWLKQSSLEKYTKDIDVIFYENSQEKQLLEDYISKKVPVIITNDTFYYENKEILNKTNTHKWITSRTENRFEQFYLIKNKESKLTLSDKNLKNIYFKESSAKNWLEYILYKEKIDPKTYKRKIEKIEKANKLIFNTFFKKDVFSIVTKDLYDAMLEFNPQVKDKVVIVKKSKEMFFRAIGFTRKDIKKEFDDMLKDMTVTINKTKTSFENVSFLQIQSVYVIEKDEDLKLLDEFYDKYLKFKGKF